MTGPDSRAPRAARPSIELEAFSGFNEKQEVWREPALALRSGTVFDLHPVQREAQGEDHRVAVQAM